MEVLVMTKYFESKIGVDYSGTMYHGKLQTGQKVAVKVWELESHSTAEEFDQFGKLCCNSKELYQRIVQMIGYYESKNRQISIYQYMPGGTLQHRIFGPLNSKTCALDWKARLKIALHIARDFKLESENIFLTKNGVPKVIVQLQRYVFCLELSMHFSATLLLLFEFFKCKGMSIFFSLSQ